MMEIKLTPDQAKDMAFPIGCRVCYNFSHVENKDDGGGDNSGESGGVIGTALGDDLGNENDKRSSIASYGDNIDDLIAGGGGGSGGNASRTNSMVPIQGTNGIENGRESGINRERVTSLLRQNQQQNLQKEHGIPVGQIYSMGAVTAIFMDLQTRKVMYEVGEIDEGEEGEGSQANTRVKLHENELAYAPDSLVHVSTEEILKDNGAISNLLKGRILLCRIEFKLTERQLIPQEEMEEPELLERPVSPQSSPNNADIIPIAKNLKEKLHKEINRMVALHKSPDQDSEHNQQLLFLLHQLEKIEMNTYILAQTRVLNVVSKLNSHLVEKVASAAKSLANKWRAVEASEVKAALQWQKQEERRVEQQQQKNEMMRKKAKKDKSSDENGEGAFFYSIMVFGGESSTSFHVLENVPSRCVKFGHQVCEESPMESKNESQAEPNQTESAENNENESTAPKMKLLNNLPLLNSPDTPPRSEQTVKNTDPFPKSMGEIRSTPTRNDSRSDSQRLDAQTTRSNDEFGRSAKHPTSNQSSCGSSDRIVGESRSNKRNVDALGVQNESTSPKRLRVDNTRCGSGSDYDERRYEHGRSVDSQGRNAESRRNCDERPNFVPKQSAVAAPASAPSRMIEHEHNRGDSNSRYSDGYSDRKDNRVHVSRMGISTSTNSNNVDTIYCRLHFPQWLVYDNESKDRLHYFLQKGSDRNNCPSHLSVIGRRTNCRLQIKNWEDHGHGKNRYHIGNLDPTHVFFQANTCDNYTAKKDLRTATEELGKALLDFIGHDDSKGRLFYDLAMSCKFLHDRTQVHNSVMQHNPFRPAKGQGWMNVVELPFSRNPRTSRKEFHGHFLIERSKGFLDRINRETDCFIKLCGEEFGKPMRFCKPYVWIWGNQPKNVDRAVEIVKDAVREHMRGCNCVFEENFSSNQY